MNIQCCIGMTFFCLPLSELILFGIIGDPWNHIVTQKYFSYFCILKKDLCLTSILGEIVKVHTHRFISKFTYTKFIFLYVLYSNQQIMLVIPTCNKLFLFTLNNKENKVNCKLIFGKIFCCQFYLMPSFLEKQNIQNIKNGINIGKNFSFESYDTKISFIDIFFVIKIVHPHVFVCYYLTILLHCLSLSRFEETKKLFPILKFHTLQIWICFYFYSNMMVCLCKWIPE